GFALFVVLVLIVIAASLAAVVMTTLSGDNRQERIERTADILHRFASEMDSVDNANNFCFRCFVAKGGGGNPPKVWPGRLWHLTQGPKTTDTTCAGVVSGVANLYGAGQNLWSGPYHLVLA